MLHRPTSLISLIFLVLGVVGFWQIEQTTAARIGVLALTILVSIYVVLYRRPDVAASVSIFFILFDVMKYLFDNILPIWPSLVLAVFCILMLWYLLFNREGWLFAITACILVAELILAMQFINLEHKVQALMTALPFIFICQYFYFAHYGLIPPVLNDE